MNIEYMITLKTKMYIALFKEELQHVLEQSPSVQSAIRAQNKGKVKMAKHLIDLLSNDSITG